MTRLRRVPAEIVDRRNVADDVIEVSVARPPSCVFEAGQHVQIELATLHHRDPRGSTRVFSLSSSPRDPEILSFAFRRSESGFKQTLEQLPLGTIVNISGPYGHVTLTGESHRPRILVASGVGITPHMSMIRFVNETKSKVPLTLLYVVTSRDRAAYLPELESHAKANSSMTFRLRIGELAAKDLAQAHAEWPDALWYLSGPPSRVLRIFVALREIGVHDHDLMTEEFIGY